MEDAEVHDLRRRSTEYKKGTDQTMDCVRLAPLGGGGSFLPPYPTNALQVVYNPTVHVSFQSLGCRITNLTSDGISKPRAPRHAQLAKIILDETLDLVAKEAS